MQQLQRTITVEEGEFEVKMPTIKGDTLTLHEFFWAELNIWWSTDEFDESLFDLEKFVESTSKSGIFSLEASFSTDATCTRTVNYLFHINKYWINVLSFDQLRL